MSIISARNTNSDTMIEMPCPQCGIKTDVNVPRMIAAIHRQDIWHCPDCGCEFKIEIVRLTRDAQQRNEAIGELADETPNNLSTKD